VWFSTWALAGVAVGLLALTLFVCRRRARRNQPEAFEQPYEMRLPEPTDIVQIDEIDEEVQ
jgi:hypothetical protein